MTDRDRLIDILADSGCVADCDTFGDLADHLLANGVIVPQCNFKDTIYRVDSKGQIYGDWELMYIQVYPDEILYIDDSDNYFVENDIGKTVFLTREEAEHKLRKEDEGK